MGDWMRTLTNERRQAIIDTATELFQEVGYKGASMNEVAKRVGGSKATLYNYFASKEELFEMVVRTHSTQFLNAAASEISAFTGVSMPFEEKLTRFGERMLEVLAGDNKALKIYRCVLSEAGNSNIGELFRAAGLQESMARLAELMSVAMQDGDLAPGDAMLRAVQFTSLIKAEVEVLMFMQEPPTYTMAQISAMVQKGVQIFLYGAVAQKTTTN
jgi:AcrR family transcriptional regulator